MKIIYAINDMSVRNTNTRLFLFDKADVMDYYIYDTKSGSAKHKRDKLPLKGCYSTLSFGDDKVLVCLIDTAYIGEQISYWKYHCYNLDDSEVDTLTKSQRVQIIDVNVVFNDRFTDIGSIWELHYKYKSDFILYSNNMIEKYKYKLFSFDVK